LLTEAFSVLCEAEVSPEILVDLVRLLARASGYLGMVGGQAADIGIGGRVETLDGLVTLHRGKTGALIEASVAMGAAVAGARREQREALQRYGAAVGLAFQLADDLLDAEEDLQESPDGPVGPPSFVRLLGPEETRRRALELVDEAVAAARSAVGGRSGVLEAIARFTVERAH
jgi:geranylgeranyl pyrophosphate synthase